MSQFRSVISFTTLAIVPLLTWGCSAPTSDADHVDEVFQEVGQSCSNDAGCSGNEYCRSRNGVKSCAADRANGAICTRNQQCESNRCVSGSCTASGGNGNGNGSTISGCPGGVGYSADGNWHDSDDWGASPLSLAMLANANAQSQLKHFDYNSHIWNEGTAVNRAKAAAEETESVLGAQSRYGFAGNVFFDDLTQRTAAERNIKQLAELATSSGNRFCFILAGPIQVLYDGLNAASGGKQNVVVISHSSWNQNHAQRDHGGASWANLKQVASVDEIPDQNPGFKTGNMNDWNWIKTTVNDGNWLWGRIDAVNRVGKTFDHGGPKSVGDASDAGMMFYLLTGERNADSEDARRWW